jgi:hypothetical protein
VFKYCPFLFVSITSIVFCIVPYVCPVFNMCSEYPVLLLLCLMSFICSFYLVLNLLPVCPMYSIGQSRHFMRYIPLLSYLFLCNFGFNICCILFFVLNATFIVVFRKNFVIFVSFPIYVKVAHFVFPSFSWFFKLFCFFFFVDNFVIISIIIIVL